MNVFHKHQERFLYVSGTYQRRKMFAADLAYTLSEKGEYKILKSRIGHMRSPDETLTYAELEFLKLRTIKHLYCNSSKPIILIWEEEI